MPLGFNHDEIAARLGTDTARVRRLEEAIRRDLAGDEPLIELRMIRTIRAMEDGALSIDEAIVEFERAAERTQGRVA